MRKTQARRILNRSDRYAAKLILRTTRDDARIPQERRIGRIPREEW